MDEQMIVTELALDEAVRELNESPQGRRPPALEHEELLRSLIEDNMYRIAGRMALRGAPTPLVARVTNDIDHLLALVLSAQRAGYRRLLDGLLPDEDRTDDATPEGGGA